MKVKFEWHAQINDKYYDFKKEVDIDFKYLEFIKEQQHFINFDWLYGYEWFDGLYIKDEKNELGGFDNYYPDIGKVCISNTVYLSYWDDSESKLTLDKKQLADFWRCIKNLNVSFNIRGYNI